MFPEALLSELLCLTLLPLNNKYNPAVIALTPRIARLIGNTVINPVTNTINNAQDVSPTPEHVIERPITFRDERSLSWMRHFLLLLSMLVLLTISLDIPDTLSFFVCICFVLFCTSCLVGKANCF